jgi:outer membrane receptor protein involved in Fe transport
MPFLERVFHFLFHNLILLLFAGSVAVAGTTGKIAGKVTDVQTHEALVGLNVVVLGTTFGAVTDVDGNYFIINLPPGTYQLKASAVGYAAVTVSDIKVYVDQTTKIDLQLQSQVLQIGEVQVIAQRPIVQKDLTSTTATVTSDQLSKLPVEDVAAVINLQAGVVEGHFRGGRSNEVRYLIDGLPVNDVFSGNSELQPEVNTVQEVQVLSGTFNAEYGEALSGVVNQVTKIGGDKYTGSISTYAGEYLSARSDLFPYINYVSPIGRADDGQRGLPIDNIECSLSGPVIQGNDFMKFFVAGRYLYDDGYIYGKRVFNPWDSSHYSKADPNQWVVVASGDGKYVPMNYNERYSLQGKLSFNLGNAKTLTVQSLYQDQHYKNYEHEFRLDPDGSYNYYQKSFLGSANYNHVFSAAAFLDVNASLFESDYQQYVYPDTIIDSQDINGNPIEVIHVNSAYQNPDLMRLLGPNTFLTGGTDNWHFSHHTNTYTGKVDFTDQVTHTHQIKTGVQVQYHSLRYLDYQVHVDATTNFVPTAPMPGSFDYNFYVNHPYQLAAYLQDNIELDYLIVNVGLRWDYFQPDGKTLKDPDNIAALDTLAPPYPDAYFTKASAKSQLSPRIGLSYPISDKGAVHISYGHFFQIPAFQYLYKNPNFRIAEQGALPEFVGNTIGNADLQPQRTTMYEIGLQQELAPNIGVTVTAYSKDIRNLLGIQIHKKLNIIVFGEYINRDYGSARGFTVSLEKRMSEGFGANLDYTYQIAEGDASDPNADFIKASAVPPVPINKELVPLDWDRRHSLNLTLTAGTADNFTGSFIARLGSGLPYTPSLENQRTGLENSDNKPTFFDADLYFTKYFRLLDRVFSLFLKIYNVFDTPDELNVFTDTGRAGYTLELTRPQVQPQGVNTLQEYFTRPDFYSAPRQVVVGASLSF